MLDRIAEAIRKYREANGALPVFQGLHRVIRSAFAEIS